MPQLRLQITNPNGRWTIPIDRDRITLGSDPGNDLQIRGRDISERHAVILHQDEHCLVRDLGSTRGTFVNDQRIEEHVLANGDQIRLGREKQVQIDFLTEGDATREYALHEIRALGTALEGVRMLSSTRVLEDVLERVLDAALELLKADRAFIMLENDAGKLEFELARARGGVTLPGGEFETSRAVPAQVFQSGKPEILPNLTLPGLADHHHRTIMFGLRAAACVPLRLVQLTSREENAPREPRTIGVLYLDSKRPGEFVASATTETLESLAASAAVAIENARLYRRAIEKARTDEELLIARQIQECILPPRRQTLGAFDFAAASIPGRAIGGDFVDYFELSDGRFGVGVADVAGKGPPAAILASLVLGLFSAWAESSRGPSETLSRVNQALLRRPLETRFTTFFYAELSPKGLVSYCNAGHNFPILLRPDGSVARLETGGFPLGVLESATYEGGQATLSPEDVLVVFSDGVTEALDPNDEQFGEERLLACLRESRALDVGTILENVLGAVSDFVKLVPQDDVTVLVVRRIAGP